MIYYLIKAVIGPRGVSIKTNDFIKFEIIKPEIIKCKILNGVAG